MSIENLKEKAANKTVEEVIDNQYIDNVIAKAKKLREKLEERLRKDDLAKSAKEE